METEQWQAEEVARWREALEAEGKRLVLTNGCFDLLHVGHVRYLREARALGDGLVVCLNGDESVRKLKGPGRPVHPEADRAELLLSLEAVDRVVLFETDDITAELRTIRPHVYAKGGDYTVESLVPQERSILEELGTEIAILSEVPGKSTSLTLRRMAEEKGRRARLGVLGSGTGSNFGAILEAIDRGSLEADVAVVLSDVEGSGILEKGAAAGVPSMAFDPGTSRSGLSATAKKILLDRLEAEGVDLVILAGFMRILKGDILRRYEGRILNIHPSLLPKFPGKDAWIQALEAGESEAGCSVHEVIEEIDAGRILGQRRLEILPGETGESLIERIHTLEHELFPRVIQEVISERQFSG
ncbi:MAG: phosphoribosylglycinamide formyltransferase [Verrucomicrobiota bacterium]